MLTRGNGHDPLWIFLLSCNSFAGFEGSLGDSIMPCKSPILEKMV